MFAYFVCFVGEAFSLQQCACSTDVPSLMVLEKGFLEGNLHYISS